LSFGGAYDLGDNCIQSVPSPKAEPFKQWMAQVASNRTDQMQDPELSIEQAVHDYRRLGYSEEWINQRLRGIEVRKMLTDEWHLIFHNYAFCVVPCPRAAAAQAMRHN